MYGMSEYKGREGKGTNILSITITILAIVTANNPHIRAGLIGTVGPGGCCGGADFEACHAAFLVGDGGVGGCGES